MIHAALGNPNSANNPGPIVGGRREINWDGGGAVVMDDFFYNEPVAVPEPATAFALLVIASLCAPLVRPKRTLKRLRFS